MALTRAANEPNQVLRTPYVTIDGKVFELGVPGTLSNIYLSASKNTIIKAPVLTVPAEPWLISQSSAGGIINYDVNTQAVVYYTANSSSNFTLNLRGDASTTLNNSLSIGNSVTIVFLNTNGATAYYQTGLSIDGVSITPKWQGGTAPAAGNASSIDVYTITVAKTADSTYTVLEQLTKFA